MDPSKLRKPSLPRLTTNVPAARRSSTSLPPAPLATKNIDPNPQQPPCGPTLFLDDKKGDENVAPFLRYAADVKPPVVRQNIEEHPVTKTKISYYEDAFAFRGAHNSPQERLAQDSVVVAELKTNYKNKIGPQFMTDLLFRLAQIYQRPETSITVTVDQDIHIMYGSNTALPSYLLKIYALPSLIAPATNLRNTALIQNALQDLLDIAPALGIVIYLPIPEENFATNGVTLRSEISRLERNDEESPSLFKTISRGMSRRLKSNSGHSAPLSQPSTADVISPSITPKSDPLKSPDVMKSPESVTVEDRGRSLRKRDSFRGLLTRRWMDKMKEKDDKERNVHEDTKEDTKEVQKEG